MRKRYWKKGFDVAKEDFYETDPEKLEYAASEKELQDRWRKILKARVISRYLDLLESENKNGKLPEDEINAELWTQASEKVAKAVDQLFTRLHQETLQDHYDRYFSSLTRAFDPHTNYMPPAKKEGF